MKPKITGRYAPQCMGKLISKIFSLQGHTSDYKRIKDFPEFLVLILASFVDEWVVNNSIQSALVLPIFVIFKLL